MDAVARPGKRQVPWAKGRTKAASTGGMTKVYYLARRVLTDHSPEMVAELVDLALNCPDEKVRAGCLIAALDRAGLRPMDFDVKAEGPVRRPPFDPSLYTTEELREMQRVMKMIAMRQGLLPPEEMEQ
jgi:hypothetical protein